ncbi:unnamed protein product [Prorocentrum cordatum]|uniref:Uncharacterized protein n=1 Tax=Prorocentrum cordatum TaxID=2364126 RepID=A0ABN9PRA3_9DINO|nr:unnamed protein product [Polarella glacialis]
MGHLHSYTGGLASQIPTGWPRQPGSGAADAGIFKTILRAPETGTDWRGHFAARLGARDERLRRLAAEGGAGLQGRLRLWWAYGRRDSARAHAFRPAASTEAESPPAWPEVVKVRGGDGGLATGVSPTTGELLAEQAAALLESPGRHIDLGVAVASETISHVAGQLSELLVHVLTREVPENEERDAVEVIVAPNAGVEAWAGSSVVRVSSLEMLFPSGERQYVTLGRPVFLVAERVPRREMRTFLHQCEAVVVATGDQSVAEAILLGKVPMVRPDAKVEQWGRALSVAAEGAVEAVPDLGEVLRRLLRSPQERSRMQRRSRERSEEAEARATAELGGSWSAAQEALVRAGMFG